MSCAGACPSYILDIWFLSKKKMWVIYVQEKNKEEEINLRLSILSDRI